MIDPEVDRYRVSVLTAVAEREEVVVGVDAEDLTEEERAGIEAGIDRGFAENAGKASCRLTCRQ